MQPFRMRRQTYRTYWIAKSTQRPVPFRAGRFDTMKETGPIVMTATPLPRWTTTKANGWWQDKDWPIGCNFLPSSAVNFLEMWSADGFDRVTIERELGWAARIGMNSIRTNLHYLAWKHDRNGLHQRFVWLLQTAADLGLSVMPVLFDDCGFGGTEPVWGPQPDPVPGIHNSRAVASPGRAAVMDQSQWPDFYAYVQDIIKTYRHDDRIIAWDLYNEPGNRMVFGAQGGYSEYDPALTAYSKALMENCFDWARALAPSQPLTVAAWRTPKFGLDVPAFDDAIDQQALALSDIITFHAYCDLAHAQRYVAQLSALDRPIMTTEWMARTINSRITDQLPFYQSLKIGAYSWGFVKGRSQTDQPWPPELEALHGHPHGEDLWFHDLLWPDGRPYDRHEIDTIAELTGAKTRLTVKRG